MKANLGSVLATIFAYDVIYYSPSSHHDDVEGVVYE